MSRRIAREIAVMLLGQVAKDQTTVAKLSKKELEDLVANSIFMLSDHAKQLIGDVARDIEKMSEEMTLTEVEHESNAHRVHSTQPVKVTTGDLRDKLERLELAVNMLSESLDIPELALHSGRSKIKSTCKKCKHTQEIELHREDRSSVRDFAVTLLETYIKHEKEVDERIREAKAKWKMERMIGIDRDILRLAITEAFFMHDIPVKVAINEAVELCNLFADKRAASFVNGVLSDLYEPALEFRQIAAEVPAEEIKL